MATARRIATTLGLLAGAHALLLRPRMIHWGATREEIKGPFPGADLIPGGRRTGTMATTLQAPPSAVWPWLAQMGMDRAGWYSWDLLDNAGQTSAQRIHPVWQSISVGQRLLSTQSGRTWFEVAAVVPERFLGLRATLTPRGKQYDPRGPRPRAFIDSLWAFQLRPLPGGRTRLIVSGYALTRPRWFGAVTQLLFWEPAHWIMQTRQFTNLKRRVEADFRGQDRPLPYQPEASLVESLRPEV